MDNQMALIGGNREGKATNIEINIIANGTIIEGKISTQGSMRIDGRVIGNVHVGGNLTVGTTGEVNGDIEAKNAIIGGKVNGTIVVAEKLVFESKAVVKGDIKASKLVVDEGAIFDGKCIMTSTSPVNKTV
jgi:cytoskeletal protein CcmA (bactofilin family)